MLANHQKRTTIYNSNLSIITALYFSVLILPILCQQHRIESKVKTQQYYKSSHYQSSDLYSIQVSRTSSNSQSENPTCHASWKQIAVKTQEQIFRLKNTIEQKRQQTIFSKITTLEDNNNIIEEFQMIGNQTFLVNTEGKGFFIRQRDGQQDQIIEVKTGLNLAPSMQNLYFNVIIKDFKQRALIISSNGISLCRSDHKSCVVLQQFTPVTYLFNAEIYTQDAITYLFLVCGEQIIVYEITAGNQLKNRKVYDSVFFKTARMHVRKIIKSNGKQFLILDSRRGIVKVSYQSKMSQLSESIKLVYDQPGCYQMVANTNNADQILLACTLAVKSFFLQKLIRSYSFAQAHFQVIETIFTSQKIYDIEFVNNFIMSRVYSGVRLYWTSNSSITPYPYDYNNAGDIFLHNALQSKLKVSNQNGGQKVIYISTEDELRKFSLKIKDPYVWCYSTKQVEEEYQLTYTYPCPDPTPMRRICQSKENLHYSSWKHGEVKITTMLIPLTFTIFGVALIGYFVIKVYRKYQNDIQKARLRYSSENEFGM